MYEKVKFESKLNDSRTDFDLVTNFKDVRPTVAFKLNCVDKEAKSNPEIRCRWLLPQRLKLRILF